MAAWHRQRRVLLRVSRAAWRYPQVKAVEVLALILPLCLLAFASTYYVMEQASVADFTQPLTRTDALYFTVTVFSTVGFGDIVLRSEAARVVLVVQMLGDLALLGAGADPAGRRAPRPAAENRSGRRGRPGCMT